MTMAISKDKRSVWKQKDIHKNLALKSVMLMLSRLSSTQSY